MARIEESFRSLIGIIKSENLPDPPIEIPNRLDPSNYFQSPRGARFPCNSFPGCRAFNSNSRVDFSSPADVFNDDSSAIEQVVTRV